jgi:hypothetical protein
VPTHAHTRARAHTRTHARARTHARTHACTHTHTHRHTRTHARTHTHTRARTHARARTRSRTHALTHTRTHTHTRSACTHTNVRRNLHADPCRGTLSCDNRAHKLPGRRRRRTWHAPPDPAVRVNPSSGVYQSLVHGPYRHHECVFFAITRKHSRRPGLSDTRGIAQHAGAPQAADRGPGAADTVCDALLERPAPIYG